MEKIRCRKGRAASHHTPYLHNHRSVRGRQDYRGRGRHGGLVRIGEAEAPAAGGGGALIGCWGTERYEGEEMIGVVMFVVCLRLKVVHGERSGAVRERWWI